MTDTRLRLDDGSPICGQRWMADVDDVDLRVLERARPAVLDVGCGPGRHVRSLAERGEIAMGIDVTPAAITAARRRGADVLCRNVFDRVPATGRWRTALLLDGNIGIGGRPTRLLARVRQLLIPGGRILVEHGPPGSGGSDVTAWLDIDGYPGPRFAWVTVGADEIAALAKQSDLEVIDAWCDCDRWFSTMERCAP
jgi:SAM-dependent methyltransferase